MGKEKRNRASNMTGILRSDANYANDILQLKENEVTFSSAVKQSYISFLGLAAYELCKFYNEK